MKETARRSIGLHDTAIVGGMGEITPSSSRHENLDARTTVLLQHQNAPAQFRSTKGCHQTGSAGADHHHVPHGGR